MRSANVLKAALQRRKRLSTQRFLTIKSGVIKAIPHIKREVGELILLFAGTVIAALGYSLFQIPHQIAAGGLGGLGIIINHFTGWPVGSMYMVMNIPLLGLGFFYLGRWRFLIRTTLAVLIFSASTDLLLGYLPSILEEYPVTENVLLSAIYAGLVGGIGGGLVYRASATMGGTGIIGRVIQLKTGIPLSQIYLYTDGGIVLAAGVVFGWEAALYAMLTLFLSGIASDYTLEGPGNVRVATIITNHGAELSAALMDGLGRGSSEWEITGSYTGQKHTMLTCTIYRPQVKELKNIVARTDPNAFVTIGVAHQALGSGFSKLRQ
ncbi:MAG: YitT family protein [Chloroflexi bacterium]|nr:MAG: YitT family protein [Chloroflexota bacterium]